MGRLRHIARPHGHSALPPSGVERWMTCHGWYHAIKALPAPPSSKYADEGTAAHDALNTCLTLGLEPQDVCSDADMALAIGHALDWLKQYMQLNAGSDFLTEAYMPWGDQFKMNALGGTTDLAVANPQELVITDYKHGVGVIVEPTSPQLYCYMIGLRILCGPREQYRNVIIQPRARHSDGPVREHVYTEKELNAFCSKVYDAIKANFRQDSERTPGEHCRWCAAAPTCRALADRALRVAAAEFADAEITQLLGD